MTYIILNWRLFDLYCQNIKGGIEMIKRIISLVISAGLALSAIGCENAANSNTAVNGTKVTSNTAVVMNSNANSPTTIETNTNANARVDVNANHSNANHSNSNMNASNKATNSNMKNAEK
jgi:hypothetical protein